MQPWQTITAVLAGGLAVMSACHGSGPTQGGTGTGSDTGAGPGATSGGTQGDHFTYDVNSGGRWFVVTGAIASYLLHTVQRPPSNPLAVHERGSVVHTRLLTDTVALQDSISGPPTGTDLATLGYMTYDSAGNAWIAAGGSHGDGAVIEYTRAQLAQGGALAPWVVIGGLQVPAGLAFDRAGTLWVIDTQADALVGYGRVRLATGGTAAPATAVSLAGIATGGGTWAPIGLSIDTSGNFWVSAALVARPAGSAGASLPASIVVEFPTSTIVDRAAPTPALVLMQSGTQPPGFGPGVTIDRSGNVWTLNARAGTITEFPVASLSPGSTPAPSLTVSAPALQTATDIAFDARGLLYAGGGTSGALYAYGPSQLTASGAPTPQLSFRPGLPPSHFAVKR